MKNPHHKLSESVREKIGTAGSEKREHMKNTIFLDEKNKTYPITVNGEPNENLIEAAHARAIMNHDEEMKAKAAHAMSKYFGKEITGSK